MNDIMIFNNPEFGDVRTLEIDHEPWFVGKDVALALGYKDTVNAIKSKVDEEDKKGWQITTPSGKQTAVVINESGLYSLIFSSKLPSAKAFKRWVTSEVLPAIRKTGSYSISDSVSKAEIAQFIIDAPTDRLPYILQLYGIAEIPTPIYEKPYWRYGDRLDRFNTIRQLMDEKGVKPDEFAKMMNYPKSTIHNYMHGHGVPSLQRCDDMIKMLNQL